MIDDSFAPNTFIRINEDSDKLKYPCHGADECSSSWTYDDWHCTGCHWKGMGRMDLEFAQRMGDTKTVERAAQLRKHIELKKQLAAEIAKEDPEAAADSRDSI
jgi:hypothetical protein